MLIIRSKNKTELIYANRISIADKSIYSYTNNTDDCLLGEYGTEKRALEVLDTIQQHISLLEHNKMHINQPDEQYTYENYVFQMPEK